MPVQMREFAHLDDIWVLSKNQGGEYVMVQRSDGSRYPVIVCPRCKRPGSCSNHTLVQEKPLTIRASYLCNQNVRGNTCGYHAMVTDGFMTEC